MVRIKTGVEVPVTLRLAGQTTVEFPAQLDTGATFCVFERGYAEALGLAVETGSPLRFSTAVGSFDAYGHMLTLETLGYSFDVTVYFAADESFTRMRLLGALLFSRSTAGNRRWYGIPQIVLPDRTHAPIAPMYHVAASNPRAVKQMRLQSGEIKLRRSRVMKICGSPALTSEIPIPIQAKKEFAALK